MKTLRMILTVVSCLSLCSGAAAVTCSAGMNQWIGTAGDNQWTTASNWSSASVPVSTDNVCIDSTFSANTIIIPSLAAANQTITSLITGAPISFAAGPLTVTGAATFNADLSIGSGTLTLNGLSSMTTLTLNGGVLTGTSTLTVTGLTTWVGGTMSGSAITNANGGINFPPGNVILDTRTVNVSGTTTFGNSAGPGFLQMQNGGTINVQAGAVWNIVSSGAVQNNGGGANTINNAGTFEMTGGAGTTIQAVFNNNAGGTVAANSGNLAFSGGGTGVAAYSVATGAKLIFTNTAVTFNFNSGTKITGAGTTAFSTIANFNSGAKIASALEVDDGTTALSTGGTITVSALNLNGGVLTGTSTLTVTGLTTWVGGTMSGSAITNANGGISFPPGNAILDTRTVNVSGSSTFGSASGGGFLQMQNGGTINVQTGAVWNIVNNGLVQNNGGGTNTINNAGTFEMTAGTGTTIQAVFNNNAGGTVAANSGNLAFSGGGTGVAAYSVATGAKLIFTNTAVTFNFNSGTKITGAGTTAFSTIANFNSGADVSSALEVDSGTTTLSTGATITVLALTLNGGVLTGPSTLTVTGLTTWAGGEISGAGITNANGGINIPNGNTTLDTRTVNVSGASTFGSPGGGAFLQMQNGGTINVQTGAVWNIVNNDLVQNNGGGTNTINNAGTFEMTAGTGTTIQAVFNNNAAGTVAANTGNLAFSGGGTGVAAYSVATGAKLIFTNTAVTFNFNAGTKITGAGTTAFSTIANFNYGAKISSGLEVDSGTTTLSTGGTITVLALTLNGGVLTGTSTLSITGLTTWPGGTMSGSGITNANGGINIPNGNTTLDTRTVNVSGASTFGSAGGGAFLQMQNGGTINVQTGAVWNIVNNDLVQNNGGGANTINNAGTFEMTAGTGTTIGVDFNNAGSVIAKAGTLAFNAAFTQTSGSTALSGGTISSALFNQQAGGFIGNGTISGNLTNTAGVVSPGFSSPMVTTGTITIGGAGSYTQGTAGALLLNLGGSASGQIDQLNMSGTASLNGALYLCLINNFQPAVGSKFKVMKYASRSGTFSTVETGWTPAYNATSLVATYNGAAAVTFSPQNLAFPTQQVGTGTTLPVQLTNSGVETLTITSISVVGANQSDFTISSNDCGTSLATGLSCSVGVTFTPSVAGKRSAILSIVDNACGLPQIVNLSGNGTNVTLAPSPVDFGSEGVGITSSPVDVTLTNHGTNAITVKTATITGTNNGDFAIQSNDCTKVVSGGTCTITLTFTPQATGARNATLNVTDTDGGSPQTDVLTGTGS